MKFYIFVQARMSSERLPGKSLIKINSKPLIKHIYDRLKYFGRKKRNIYFDLYRLYR